MKEYLAQMLAMLTASLVIGVIVIYCISVMIGSLRKTIMENPYPYKYDKPTSATSSTIYNGRDIDEFTRMLDDLANRLDGK